MWGLLPLGGGACSSADVGVSGCGTTSLSATGWVAAPDDGACVSCAGASGETDNVCETDCGSSAWARSTGSRWVGQPQSPGTSESALDNWPARNTTCSVGFTL